MNKEPPVLEHPYPFDPTYGYDLERLLAVDAPEAPSDFAEFWEGTFEEARAIPLRLEHRQVSSAHSDRIVHEVEFDSLDGVRIGGWMVAPRDCEPVVGGWVIGHGYGGRESPEEELRSPAAPAIYFCARGFNRSACAGIPDNSSQHVLHGIEHRDTYVHRGCVADLWQAAAALIELHPGAAANLRYVGGSFGGGIGALALPWDHRFRKAFLDYPSFGNHPLRVRLPCDGSGRFVSAYYREHPEVLDTLAYFDAATAARHIHIPVLFAGALFDPCVPPPGQFAVYNALPGPKKLYVRSTAHFPSDFDAPEANEVNSLLAEWFA